MYLCAYKIFHEPFMKFIIRIIGEASNNDNTYVLATYKSSTNVQLSIKPMTLKGY